jgi:putative membrane protein
MWEWGHSGWGLFWMIVGMVVFWGAFVGVIAMVMRSGDRREPRDSSPDAAEILRRRFASGEIAEDEYRQRLRTLEGSSH